MSTVVGRTRARALAAALSTIALTSLFAAGSPRAHAAVADLTCPGTESVTFTPGLLLTLQQVTLHTSRQWGPCVSSDPTVSSGSDAESFVNTISCLSVAAAGTGTVTFTWSNGRTSTFAFTKSVSHPVGQTVVTYTGNITAGEFAGDSALETITGAALNLTACLAPPGITSTFGVAVLEITSA